MTISISVSLEEADILDGGCFALRSDEIAVRWWSLNRKPTEYSRLYSYLSLNERVRVRKFRSRQLRDQWVAARGGLRRILGNCLDLLPESIRFNYSPTGKPELSTSDNPSSIHFNLSHSEDRAIAAFATQRTVGVDLEKVRGQTNYQAVAEGFFSKRERRILAAMPLDNQRTAFFGCWTRKEAYLKALGVGLGASTTRFSALFPDFGTNTKEKSTDTIDRIGRFQIQSLNMGAEWTAAVVWK